jgi:protein TonB
VKPTVKTQAPPAYPDALREKGVEATVVLRVLVTETGQVSDVKVLRPASEPAFNEAALAAVRRWTFSPCMKKGQAVACWYAVGVPFQLK